MLRPKLARWLQIGEFKPKRYRASATALSYWRAWMRDPDRPAKETMEKFRVLMRGESNPMDKAIYLRLFRKARNLTLDC